MLTDFNIFGTVVTGNEFLRKYKHLFAYYFNIVLLMTSLKRHCLLTSDVVREIK